MAQTTAVLGLRPVAKALGMSVVAMATRGLGMSASAHSRSMTPCSSGACSGVTSLACMANMAILSLKQYWQNKSPNADDQDQDEAVEDGEEDADEHGVEDDEEEARHEHPVGQAPVRLDVA